MHTCTNCRHWHLLITRQVDRVKIGECHRYPPTIYGYGNTNALDTRKPSAWAWPITTGAEGCGEFKGYTPQPLARLFARRGT